MYSRSVYAPSMHCFIEQSMNIIADVLSIPSLDSSFLHGADTPLGSLQPPPPQGGRVPVLEPHLHPHLQPTPSLLRPLHVV